MLRNCLDRHVAHSSLWTQNREHSSQDWALSTPIVGHQEFYSLYLVSTNGAMRFLTCAEARLS